MKAAPLPNVISAASYIADHPETGIIVSYGAFGAGIALMIGAVLVHNECSVNFLFSRSLSKL